MVAPPYILINSVGGFLFPHTEGTFLDDLQRSLSVSPFLPPPTFSLSLSLFVPRPSFPSFFVQPRPSWYFAPSSFLDVLNLQVWSPQLSKTSRLCLSTTFLHYGLEMPAGVAIGLTSCIFLLQHLKAIASCVSSGFLVV